MIYIYKLIKKLFLKINNFKKKKYFGFIKGHQKLSKKELRKLQLLVGKFDKDIEDEFEKSFSKLIGDGFCISYGAGRMGFFEIMKLNKIRENDQIILLGQTCSVMVNAIKRIGATPIYSDIDPETLGSDVNSIRSKITNKTKMIIAQHSFGIPCDIEPIVKLAKEKNIFLLEDCALTLGSKVNDKIVGNFGDAALFSTDHTKPINALIGGLIYTKNLKLYKSLKKSQIKIPSLGNKKQKALWRQFLFECNFRNPSNNGKVELVNLILKIKKYIFGEEEPFLSDEYFLKSKNSYPYPCRMPSFLAAIGINEIKNWDNNKLQKEYYLKRFIDLFKKSKIKLLKIYENKNINIIPLRFILVVEDDLIKKSRLSIFIETYSFWFKKPIIGTIEDLKFYDYSKGECPRSEMVCSKIINIPCSQDYYDFLILEKKLKLHLNSL